MNIEDVMYVICLLACIGAGKFIRKVPLESQRQLLCTALGVLMVYIVSSLHILHTFFSMWLGGLAIMRVHPSKCHIVTFFVMFGYLTVFRLIHLTGLPEPPGHTNMIQMMLTLKVAGLAFEKTASWKKMQQREKQLAQMRDDTWVDRTSGDKLIEITDYDVELQSISMTELFHYSFNYIGVLTGPYYRYRTYRDYFETTFRDHAPSVAVTKETLKYAGYYCVLYLVANYLWPLDYALSEVFYSERSFFYRLMYVWPTFFIFRMRMYTGLTLSECVCTMAGFGAYPVEADCNNGEGPRKPYAHLKRDADRREYNFTTIVNTRVRGVETCWTFREAMKHWNICVQYWLAVYVYKLFPSKKFRTAATLFVSAFWHGFLPGHYFCIMGAPIYVPLENMWNKLVRERATGTKRQVIDAIFWIAKFFTFSYLGTAFLLVSFENIWRFYSSVYHIGYVTYAVMLILGLILTSFFKKSSKGSEKEMQKEQEPLVEKHKESVKQA